MSTVACNYFITLLIIAEGEEFHGGVFGKVGGLGTGELTIARLQRIGVLISFGYHNKIL